VSFLKFYSFNVHPPCLLESNFITLHLFFLNIAGRTIVSSDPNGEKFPWTEEAKLAKDPSMPPVGLLLMIIAICYTAYIVFS
jgi:hypothetical protein